MRVSKTEEIKLEGSHVEFWNLFHNFPHPAQALWEEAFRLIICGTEPNPVLKLTAEEWSELTRYGKPPTLVLERDDLPPAEARGRFTGNVLTRLPGERLDQYTHRMEMEQEIDRRMQESLDRHQRPPLDPREIAKRGVSDDHPAEPAVDTTWVYDKDHPMFSRVYNQDDLDFYRKINRIPLADYIPRRKEGEPMDEYRVRLEKVGPTIFESILEVMERD